MAAVAQPAEHRRREHVDDQERGREQSQLRVRRLHLRALQALDERGHDEAVEIVEEIGESQEGDGPEGRTARRLQSSDVPRQHGIEVIIV
jgi:hypothetical protein